MDDLIYSSFYQSALFDMFMAKGHLYNQKDCLELCQQHFYILNCNCTLTQYFSLFDQKNCNTVDELDCAFDVFFNVINKPGFFELKCYTFCPLECNMTNFNAFITLSDFSKDIYVDVVQARENFRSKYDAKTLDANAVRNRLLRVNIFYDSLSYTHITESVSMNGVSLLAAIGGFMGMFLGMSLMTLVEILEIFLRIILKKN